MSKDDEKAKAEAEAKAKAEAKARAEADAQAKEHAAEADRKAAEMEAARAAAREQAEARMKQAPTDPAPTYEPQKPATLNTTAGKTPKDKLAAMLRDMPKDTPDDYNLYGYGGHRFTFADAKVLAGM